MCENRENRNSNGKRYLDAVGTKDIWNRNTKGKIITPEMKVLKKCMMEFLDLQKVKCSYHTKPLFTHDLTEMQHLLEVYWKKDEAEYHLWKLENEIDGNVRYTNI